MIDGAYNKNKKNGIKDFYYVFFICYVYISRCILFKTKFNYKISCNLKLKLAILFNKINIIAYFKNLTVKLHILNTHQILCQLDIIYYMIYKFIFYA